MATRARRVMRPLRRGKILRAARGYKLKKVDRRGIALMRGNVKTTTFTCECNAPGGCRVGMDDPSDVSGKRLENKWGLTPIH